MAHRFLLPWGMFVSVLFFCAFLFTSLEPVRDIRTDRRTDGQDPQCGLLGRPYNKPNRCTILPFYHNTVKEREGERDDRDQLLSALVDVVEVAGDVLVVKEDVLQVLHVVRVSTVRRTSHSAHAHKHSCFS